MKSGAGESGLWGLGKKIGPRTAVDEGWTDEKFTESQEFTILLRNGEFF